MPAKILNQENNGNINVKKIKHKISDIINIKNLKHEISDTCMRDIYII